MEIRIRIMPAIIIKDYQWRQTEKRIIIYVPLKNRPKNVDLFVLDNYLKISFPPFILELFLWGNILEDESECTLTDAEAIFSLQKANIAINWQSLEIEGLNKEEKHSIKNRVSEKTQSISENCAKSRSKKYQYLQKEAIRTQINLDTDMLNRIESMKDAYRKAAMQDLEAWRSNAEMPIFQNISGKVQKNKKEYRPPLKWFKDDDGIQSREINKTNEIEMIRKRQNKSVVIEKLKEELIVKENIKKALIIEENMKEESIIKSQRMKEKINIEQKLKEELALEDMNKELTIKTDMKTETISSKNFQTEADILLIKKTAIPNKNLNFTKSSSFENSEPEYITSPKSLSDRLVKGMDQKSLQKKMKKKEPDLIDKILKGEYSIMNQIFDEPKKTVPLPRRSGTINIIFSERVLPTPARESSYTEEQEWLSKQAEARRKTGFIVEDLRPDERDPQWLKDKGDDFFRTGNYLAAISAYTHGIKISDKLAALYVNRSAAHYAIGNYYRCIDDCSKVLELMEPKCENNRISRAKCHARRGAALCKLSAPQHGIPELEAALKLDPNNESIKHDLHTVKQYFNIKG